jgi:TonB family protein
MILSSIAIEQREKEVKALKTFLVCSTIGSLVLHVAVLASGIGNLLARAPELDEDKPIELTFVEPEVKDTPITEEKKPLPEEPKLGVGDILTSSGGGGSVGGSSPGGGSSIQSSPQLQAQIPVTVQAPPQALVPIQKNIEKPVEKPVIPQTFTPPVQKLVENFKREVSRPQPQKEDVVTSSKPQNQVNSTPKQTTPVQKIQESQPSTKVVTNNTPVQSSTSNQNSENLRNTLGNIRDSRASLAGSSNSTIASDSVSANGTRNGAGISDGNGSSTGNGVGFGTGSGTGSGSGSGNGIGSSTGTGSGSGNGTGSGTGSGTGTGSGSGNGTGSGTGSGTGTGSDRSREVATAPTTPILPKPETKPRTSSQLNATECEKCELKYPERARRRGVEGSPKVQFDVDENGKTTNVRLARSSGDSELDAAAVEQAREFRLKPSAAGRRNVQASANYVQKGSQREREVEERRRQREQRRQQSEAQESQQVASNNSSEETPRRRRRLEASVNTNNTDAPVSSSRRRQSLETASSNFSESGNNRLSRRLRRQAQASTTNTEDSSTRRVQRSEENFVSDRLRRRRLETSSGQEAPRRQRREVTADVRTSGEQQAPTKRRRRQLKLNQSSDSGSRLRSVLRRSRESAPAAEPSLGKESNE